MEQAAALKRENNTVSQKTDENFISDKNAATDRKDFKNDSSFVEEMKKSLEHEERQS